MKYTFRNTKTDEVFEVTMKLAEYDDYLKNNPDVERYHTPDGLPGFGDNMRMSTPGYGRGVSAFERGVIDRVKKIPGNTVVRGHKTYAPKEW